MENANGTSANDGGLRSCVETSPRALIEEIVHEKNDKSEEFKVDESDKKSMNAWREEVTTRLSEVEKTLSKILFCMQYAIFNSPKERKSTPMSTPKSCPQPSKKVTVNLSDYEDLDDYPDEEHANIEMDVTSEDDDMPKGRKKSKGRKKKAKTTPACGAPNKRGSSAKAKSDNEEEQLSSQKRKPTNEVNCDANKTKGNSPGKKLFGSPTLAVTTQKLEKTKPVSPSECSGKNVSVNSPKNISKLSASFAASQIYNVIGKTLPKNWASRFVITSDMGLSEDELQVAAYFFSLDIDQSEVVFKIRNTRAIIKDFDCLCPGKTVEDEMIKLMAMRITWRQIHVNVQTVWAMPPSFAIYVPKKENDGHYYNSALWVLEWMAMEFTFQPNVHGVMNEKRVRIKTALSLLLGPHNKVRKMLETRA
ncbi:hypothetical protein SESBI_28493 [Sesbania bispinosa]|nr:hypothetical protein SESBI_28493 [Sesbania bispinosa]